MKCAYGVMPDAALEDGGFDQSDVASGMSRVPPAAVRDAAPVLRLRTIPSTAISFYEHNVPAFAAYELERLYSTPFSTLSMFTFKDAAPIDTYVVSRGDRNIAVLLFRREGTTIRVLNEGMRISAFELMRFARAAFDRYSSAQIIRFRAIDGAIKDRGLPRQQLPVLEDIVVKLGRFPEQYRKSLGKSTRAYLNRYQNKIKREHPSFRHDVLVGSEIEEEVVRELLELHKARMEKSGRKSLIDDERLEEILHIVRKYGLVLVARIDGKVCGGTINYHVGKNYFLECVAHDSAYDDCRMGTICAYLTVCECISRGGEEYHFLWGDYDYKFRLGGIPRKLNDIYVYRSKYRQMLNCRIVLQVAARNVVSNLKKRAKQHLHRIRLADTFWARIARRALPL